MHKLVISLITVCLSLGISSLVMSQDDKSFYGGLQVGLSIPKDTVVTNTGVAVAFDRGLAFGVKAGYKWSEFRIELEYNKYNNGAKYISGSRDSQTLMGNVFYDYKVDENWRPFVGVGIGETWLNHDSVAANSITLINQKTSHMSFQGIVGVGYAINKNTRAELAYHYIRATGDGFSVSTNTGNGFSDHPHHALFLGMNYFFGGYNKPAPKAEPIYLPPPRPEPAPVVIQAPKPVPEPMPEPVPVIIPAPEPFRVYFGFDSVELDGTAKGVIMDAVNSYKSHGSVSLNVRGYTDSAGASAYNDALAERRAAVVHQALIAAGIDVGDVSANSYGENSLAVKTGDNTKNDNNRRVEGTFKLKD